MCGIAGIIGRIGDRNRAALQRMSQAMSHRGPDGQGTWESPPDERGRGALLAHRRLAILDLSPAGAQPMIDPASGQVIVFNGEIYNFQALRDRLVAKGERFESTGDTQVMLRALGTEGNGAVASFRGMFAFATWDPKRRKLLLARDPLGIKPLYVARCPDRDGEWSVAFASEVRALLASGLLGKARLHPEAAASVVWNGFVMGPDTVVQGVESVSPGQLRVYGSEGAEEVSEDFWTMPAAASGASMDEEQLSGVLEECLRLHLISDVPLGVFLSSGVDSSAVANLAQKANRGPIHTFTLAFEEREYTEGPEARRIAEAIGTDHREIVLSEQHFVSRLDDALESLDQPSFDGLNSYYMSRAVRDAGFTVALVGTGGDELFGGYTTFRDLPMLHRWSQRLRWMPRSAMVAGAKVAVSRLQRRTDGFPPQTRWAKLPEMVRRGDDLLALYQLAYALFLPDFQHELLGANGVLPLRDGLSDALRARLGREIRSRSLLSAVSVLDQRVFLGERLLRDNDAVSMAASIEQRLPLVDQVLLESVSRVPDAARYQPLGQKAMLRRIGLRGLDPALFARPKSGFVLPFDRWIRRGLSTSIDQTLRDPAAVSAAGLDPKAVGRLWQAFLDGASGLYWSRIWAIYVLVRFCIRHEVHR
ncbi:MAG TPA: asparagine synthase (glutamine-hydrolyzing) [Myxococcales bacterium]|nr:asparagine synthase (glutamine-hydrolyzing) [Myxococcales bacterium]